MRCAKVILIALLPLASATALSPALELASPPSDLVDLEFPLDITPLESDLWIRASSVGRIQTLDASGRGTVRCLVNIVYHRSLGRFPEYTPGQSIVGGLATDPADSFVLVGASGACSIAPVQEPVWNGPVHAAVRRLSMVQIGDTVFETWMLDVPAIATRECDAGTAVTVSLERTEWSFHNTRAGIASMLCRDDLRIRIAEAIDWPIE